MVMPCCVGRDLPARLTGLLMVMVAPMVGLSGGKVRIVFDKPKESVKPYYVMKTDTGLRVLFGAAACQCSTPGGHLMTSPLWTI